MKRVWDAELSGLAVEIRSSNVSACALESISELGVSLPFLVLIVKNLNKYFTFQVTVSTGSDSLSFWSLKFAFFTCLLLNQR